MKTLRENLYIWSSGLWWVYGDEAYLGSELLDLLPAELLDRPATYMSGTGMVLFDGGQPVLPALLGDLSRPVPHLSFQRARVERAPNCPRSQFDLPMGSSGEFDLWHHFCVTCGALEFSQRLSESALMRAFERAQDNEHAAAIEDFGLAIDASRSFAKRPPSRIPESRFRRMRNRSMALHGRGVSRYATDQTDEAFRDFTAAIRGFRPLLKADGLLHSPLGDALMRRAEIWHARESLPMASRDWRAASEAFEAAIGAGFSHHSDLAVTLMNLATACKEQEWEENARDAIDRAGIVLDQLIADGTILTDDPKCSAYRDIRAEILADSDAW